MFDFEVTLSMENGEKIKYRETTNDKEKFMKYLVDNINCENKYYMIIDEDINGDSIWIKDIKDIQHVAIREI